MSELRPSDQIPYIDGAAVEKATPMPALVAEIEKAFVSADMNSPERLSAEITEDERLLVMPAWDGNSGLGVKIVAIDQRRRPSINSHYLFIDRTSGMLRAVLDGNVLTKRRTAAASVLAATKLASRSDTLLLIGTGALIAPLIEGYSQAFPLRSISIWGRDRKKAEAIAAQARADGHNASVADDLDAHLRQCDIVSAATQATSPLIAGDRLAPGAHVDLIGAYTSRMCEADPATFARSAIFVDTIEGARAEAGDLIQAVQSGAIAWNDVCGDLHQLCTGRIKRPNGKDLTLFKSVGTGIEDLAAAKLVLESLGL